MFKLRISCDFKCMMEQPLRRQSELQHAFSQHVVAQRVLPPTSPVKTLCTVSGFCFSHSLDNFFTSIWKQSKEGVPRNKLKDECKYNSNCSIAILSGTLKTSEIIFQNLLTSQFTKFNTPFSPSMVLLLIIGCIEWLINSQE